MEVTHIGYFYISNDFALRFPKMFFMSVQKGKDIGLCVDEFGVSHITNFKIADKTCEFEKRYNLSFSRAFSTNQRILYLGQKNKSGYSGGYRYENASDEGCDFTLELLEKPSAVLNMVARGLEQKFGFEQK